jgi:hypothetical protein
MQNSIPLNSNLVSDGVYGKLTLLNNSMSPLKSNKNLLDPSIILSKYNKILNISYSKFY